MDSSQVNVVKVENQHEFDWLYLEEHFERSLEFSPPPSTDSFEHSLNSFFDFDIYQNCHFPYIEFKDFENLSSDFCKWDDSKIEVSTEIQREFTSSSQNEEGNKQSGRSNSKSALLELDEIQKHFDVPITKAAREMKVGLTVLKKRCRELNIMRWPHRKIKSLKSLINNVKELGMTNEIEMLEEHKRLLEKLPQMELTEKTKKLRQACFKANYKKKRYLASLA